LDDVAKQAIDPAPIDAGSCKRDTVFKSSALFAFAPALGRVRGEVRLSPRSLVPLRRTLWISADPPEFDYTIFYPFRITQITDQKSPKKYTSSLVTTI
jgi:hypothetical protein